MVTQHLTPVDSLNWALDLLALLYALLFFPAPIFWLIIHPTIQFWRRFGTRAYWVALPLWLLSGATLLFLRQELFADRLSRNTVTTLIGTGLVLLGLWLNRRVHREFSWRRLVGFPEITPERHPGGVVRSGIYANLRHPRYLEFMITFMGLALLTGAVGIFVLAILTVLLYLIVAPLEERELRQQYGQAYEAYRSEVPRFLPRRRRSGPRINP
jgi:protein-S-isoprenylcysteine O-methyltransferase Ste14